MFKIILPVLGIIVAIAFPPLAIIIVAIVWVYVDKQRKKVRELKRQREVFINHVEQDSINRVYKSW